MTRWPPPQSLVSATSLFSCLSPCLPLCCGYHPVYHYAVAIILFTIMLSIIALVVRRTANKEKVGTKLGGTKQRSMVMEGEGESGLKFVFNLSRSYRRLQVEFGGVCRCRCGELIWTCLVWGERSGPGSLCVPSHRLNSATGEQNGITQTIILTLSRPSSCLTHPCQAPGYEEPPETQSGIEPAPQVIALTTRLLGRSQHGDGNGVIVRLA